MSTQHDTMTAGRRLAGSTTQRSLLALLLAIALVVMTACGGGSSSDSSSSGGSSASRAPLADVKPASDPKAIKGPSTAKLAAEDIDAVAKNPKQTLPATVVSHDRSGDKNVTIEAKDTKRVAALNLSGSLAATVYGLGLGDTLVAKDQSTTFPAAAKLPTVTEGGHSINAEAVLATKPTLVITDGSIGPRDVIEQLRDAGVKVVFVKNTASFAGAGQLAKDVAAIYGVPAEGTKLATQIAEQVKTTEAAVTKIAPSEQSKKLRIMFLYVRGNAGVYYLFGKGSGADDLIKAVDGIDITTEQGWQGMRPMTDEAVTKANPDLILVMTKGIESAGGVDGLLKSKPALALTNAGKNRRFVDMADGDILSFGPRSADVIDSLARAIYAPTGTK